MSIPCDKTFLLVPSSRSSVKVKYQGHSFRKNCEGAVAGKFAWVKVFRIDTKFRIGEVARGHFCKSCKSDEKFEGGGLG